MTARSERSKGPRTPAKAFQRVRGGLSGPREEGRTPEPSASVRRRRSLPKDDMAAGTGTWELRKPSVSEVSWTPDRQPGPVQDMGVDHRGRDTRLGILPISQPAAHGLSARVRSQVLGRALFEAKSPGSLDETLGPLEKPLGRLAAENRGQPRPLCSGSKRLLFDLG